DIEQLARRHVPAEFFGERERRLSCVFGVARLLRRLDGAQEARPRLGVTAGARLSEAERRQRLREQGLLAARLEAAHGGARHTLGLAQPPLGDKDARARLVHLRHAAGILQADEEGAGALEVLVRLGVPADIVEEEAEVILDARAVAGVTRLLEVVARGGVLDERAV